MNAISSSLLANAAINAPFPLCEGINAPVNPENKKSLCVPFQLSFAENTTWLVDLTTILNAQAVTQLRGIWIDATQSADNVLVYFPDTGYEVEIEAGYGQFIPAITRQYNYRFIVSLVSALFPNVDLVNIIATNFMIPTFTTFNPTPLEFTQAIDVNISQRQQDVQNGCLIPISATMNGGNSVEEYVGGYQTDGSGNYWFEVVTYNVLQLQPVEVLRISSPTFTVGDPQESVWCLTPDGTRIVMMLMDANTDPLTFYLCVYDIASNSFGSIYVSSSFIVSQPCNLAFLDQNTFCFSVGAAAPTRNLGVHVFTLTGVVINDKGFFNVWPPNFFNSITIGLFGFYFGASLIPVPGGLLSLTCTFPSTTFTVYACLIAWNGNNLIAGIPYKLTQYTFPGNSGQHANFVQTGVSGNYGEYTIIHAGVLNFAMFSFVPLLSNAAIVRQPLVSTYDFGENSTCFPVVLGNFIGLLERSLFDNNYRIQYVLLYGANFYIFASKNIPGMTALSDYFCACKIRGNALLFGAVGGFNSDLGQLGIITL